MMRSFIRSCSGRGVLRSLPSAQRTSRPALPASQPLSLQRPLQSSARYFHASVARPKQRDASKEHKPANLSELDVLGNTPTPSTSVDVCMSDGFGLNNGITIGDGNGALLVSGEAFEWRPWEAKGSMELVNKKGQLELPAEAFGLFDLIWPRPDLLIVGVGKSNMPLSPETRRHISELGMRVETLDTRNAAAQFNLLATERGVTDVAAALIPIGWKEGIGARD